MAGDWIKMDCSTPDKPEVLAITARMGWDDPDLTVGKLFKLWRWFDQHTVDGNARGVTSPLLDRQIGATGFITAVAEAGWLSITEAGIVCVGFEKHNGATAKSRAQTAKRVASHRSNAEGNALSVTPALAREEKRREEQEEREPKTKTARKRAAAPQHVSLADLLAEGVDEQHAKDWLAVRQRKSLPLTLTAWAEMKAEALKARIAVPEAVRVSAANSWAGFKAAWLQQAGQGPPGRQTATDRRIETIHALTGKHHERPDQPTIIDITPRLVS